MAYWGGAYGVAAVQAAADILTLFLALPLIRRVKRQIGAAQEAQKRTAGQMINSEV